MDHEQEPYLHKRVQDAEVNLPNFEGSEYG
jgi:hypothetical protein